MSKDALDLLHDMVAGEIRSINELGEQTDESMSIGTIERLDALGTLLIKLRKEARDQRKDLAGWNDEDLAK